MLATVTGTGEKKSCVRLWRYLELLGFILGEMRQIERLDLKLLDTVGGLDKEPKCFSPLFNFQSAYLSHLSLSGFEVMEHAFIDLVSQHADSITSLQISEERLLTNLNEGHAQAC